MKKYIKASDGSFVSFAKKDKKTFRPVSAACGGKKKVKAAESNINSKYLGYEWNPKEFGVDGLGDDIVKAYDLVLKRDANLDDYDYSAKDFTSAARAALDTALKEEGMSLAEVDGTDALADALADEVDSFIAVQYSDGTWDFGATSSRSGHCGFGHLGDSVPEVLEFWADMVAARMPSEAYED